MQNLFWSFIVTAAVTAIIAGFPLSTRRSFFAVVIIASTLGAFFGFTMSVINDATLSESWLAIIVCTLFASCTVFTIGWRWGRKIMKRKEMAPFVVIFLRSHFAEIARENALGNPTITEALLEAALNNYRGSELTTIMHIKKHFREIGHVTSLPLVPVPVDGDNFRKPDFTDDYHYEMTRDDFERYIPHLQIKYAGW